MEQMLFGEILLNFHLVREEDLNKCLKLQRLSRGGKQLGEILVERGYLDERILSTILTVQEREIDAGETVAGMSTHDMARRLETADVLEMMKLAREIHASDLYLSADKTPMVRQHGMLCDLPIAKLTPEKCERLIFSLLTKKQHTHLTTHRDLDFCMSLADGTRSRISIFRHDAGLGAIIRLLSNEVRPLSTLDLPSAVKEFTDLRNGLVLVTGPAGSGKTTTLCAMVEEINSKHKRHIITLEDPIESVFESRRSLITQREVGTHTRSFADGLRAALREDPDVIVVGELRDAETFKVALAAAETGHLVFGTLHTRSATGTILRVIEQFPGTQRNQIRMMLAGTLRGVVCQELIPNLDGTSRSVAVEVMTVNAAIANLIREDRAWQIPMVMQTNTSSGMALMDSSLRRLVENGLITVEEAISRASDPSRFMVPV